MMFPQTVELFSDDSIQPPRLSPVELKYFQDIGAVFGLARPGDTFGLKSGKHFFDGLFRAIIRLSKEEIGTPFEKLPPTTLYKMAQALLSLYPEEEKLNLIILDWLINFQELTSKPREGELKRILDAYSVIEDAPQLSPLISDPTVYIQAHRDSLKKALELLFYRAVSHSLSEAAPGACLARCLAPLHAMAQGIYPFLAAQWEECANAAKQNPDILGLIIQGDVSKDKLIEHLTGLLPQKKGPKNEMLTFLIKWVETNERDNIGALLKFATGSTAFYQVNIKFIQNPESPLFTASTCQNELSIPLHPKLSTQKEFNDWLEKSLFEQGGVLNR